MNKTDAPPDTSKVKNFSMRIEEKFFHRLNNHVNILKKLESRSHSKQRWIEDSIKEKLDTEESDLGHKIPSDKYISFTVPEYLCKRIDKRVELNKKFKISYSTKKWLLEAMIEKLEREEEKAKKLLLQLKKINAEF